MKSQALAILTCVLSGVAIILGLYCVFKSFNLGRKVNTVSDFVNGEVFSGRFHTILSNYFANEDNSKRLLEPTLPWLRDLLLSGQTQNISPRFKTEIGGFLWD